MDIEARVSYQTTVGIVHPSTIPQSTQHLPKQSSVHLVRMHSIDTTTGLESWQMELTSPLGPCVLIKSLHFTFLKNGIFKQRSCMLKIKHSVKMYIFQNLILIFFHLYVSISHKPQKLDKV
jgi:hypothetical protein